MKPIANLPAIVVALLLAQATVTMAQLAPSGPSGVAASAIGAVPGVATPLGAVPGTTTGVAPNTGGILRSTTPPPSNLGPGITSSSGGPGSATVGRSARPTKDERKEEALIEAGEREVDRRIQNICRGC
ncbi:hypothetical protein [Bradyrhizobium sp. LHD-71]|uniref:hypothetical protein n=1 Tax=Bradyrhizobium sp. LHD-71 TaxID=3072141 RepID=UPI00280D313C|nr:hypothetical protein [Bradyrhizobium sp. LHD-71]MDQ8727708.1 hypothetical protein [Bradyrhizobium sp. LHD-71]